jgi:hypothetical protein
MNRQVLGFSLIELLMAMTVSLVMATMLFHLFHQNERVMRDQTLIMEMQQTARIVASQIADELRMAGQGLPIYASKLDAVPSEATVVILGSSGPNRVNFRAGLSNMEAASTTPGATDFNIGVGRSVSLTGTSGISTGKFVYVFGPSTTEAWTWLRAQVNTVSSNAITLTPRNTANNATAIHFSAPMSISMEEAVAIYLSGTSVRRAGASNLTDPLNPIWSAANEIGKNVVGLVFTYYDASGNTVQPTTLLNRDAIFRIDIQLTVEAAGLLSNGTRPRYTLSLRTIPRNALLRASPV